MKKYICICCIIIFLFVSPGCHKENSGKHADSSNVEENIKAGDILYGKYPEPILIAIGELNEINKDYKKLTKDDLKKVTNLFFYKEYGFSYISKKYGFKENEEYDFSMLLEMPNLTSLNLDFGTSKIRLKDYSTLKNLKNLKNLYISNICDSDMDKICEIKSLEGLSILNSDITNINFLEKQCQLKELFLDHCYNIKNFEALKYLKNINQIGLSNLNMTEKELDTIPNIPSLTNLSLIGNNLTNITSFPVLINLANLGFDYNPLKSISIPSGNLSKIRTLSICNTSISDASKIEGVDTIEEVYMYNSKISKVAPFKKFKNLKLINTTIVNIEDKESLNGTSILLNQD